MGDETLITQFKDAMLEIVHGAKHTWAINPNAQRLGGAGGIWNDPHLEDAVINLVPLPEGLLSRLPSFTTQRDVEKYAYITGYTAPDDRDETHNLTACGPCQTVGMEKNCFQKAPWGYKCLDSRQLKLLDSGHMYSKADPMDLYVINPPTVAQNMGAPGPSQFGRRDLIDPIDQQYDLIGREYIHWFNRTMLWYGSPANNVVTNDGEPLYMEPYGLTTLINTNHVDERDGQTLCRNLDSEIVNWGNININAQADLFLRTITSHMRVIWKRADKTNMLMNPGTDWALVMRDDLFYAITRIWPCIYTTTNCQTLAGGGVTSTAFVDANQLARMSDDLNADAMYSRQNPMMRYLMVAGVRVPVIVDDGLNEVNNGDGTFTSSIYYVPLTMRGNIPATFMQFFNYDGTGAAPELARRLRLNAPAFATSDGGRFLWMAEAQRACAILTAMTMPRTILRTPQLAMAINNVRYTVDAHTDDSFDDQAYWRGCGVYEVDLPTNYGPFGDQIQHGPGGGVEVIG